MNTADSSAQMLPTFEFAQALCGSGAQPIILDSPATPVPIERERGLSFRGELESFGDLEPTGDQHTQIYLADLLEHVLSQNLHTNEGFMYALQLARRVVPHQGSTLWGLVCSSWVWMPRSSTGRSSNKPLGRESAHAFADGNCMVSRMMLIVLFCRAKSGR